MIREATQEDIPSIAHIHIEGWKAAYGGLVNQDYLDSLSADQRTADWTNWLGSGETTVLVEEQDGKAVGFIAFGRTKTPPPGSSIIRPLYSAEIYALYLLPDVWRQGVGKALLKEASRRLKEQKHTSLCLWVLDGNARAKSFYEAIGGQRAGKKMVEIGPSKLKEICYGWRETDELRAS
jgi:GNAT superfamily N-acetyltransferase